MSYLVTAPENILCIILDDKAERELEYNVNHWNETVINME